MVGRYGRNDETHQPGGLIGRNCMRRTLVTITMMLSPAPAVVPQVLHAEYPWFVS